VALRHDEVVRFEHVKVVLDDDAREPERSRDRGAGRAGRLLDEELDLVAARVLQDLRRREPRVEWEKEGALAEEGEGEDRGDERAAGHDRDRFAREGRGARRRRRW